MTCQRNELEAGADVLRTTMCEQNSARSGSFDLAIEIVQ